MVKRGRRKTISKAGEGEITIMLGQEDLASSVKENQAKSQNLTSKLDLESSLCEGEDEAQEELAELNTEEEQDTKEKEEKKWGKSWVDLFKNNREGDSGLKLKKVHDDREEVVITKEDIEPEVKFWQYSLIAFIVGQDVPANVMVNFLKFRWKGLVFPHVIKHEEGYFILRFENCGDMERALAKGVQYFYSKPMLLRKWIEGVPKPEELRVVPVWIQLPKLPLGFWGGSTLSKIVSKIGDPIKTDELTARKLKIEYARVLVNIEVGKELLEKVTVKSEDEGYCFTQEIKYEWMPVICKKCKRWGHKEEKCYKKGTMQWQEKKKMEVKDEKGKQEQIIIGKEEVPIPAQKVNGEENRDNEGKKQEEIVKRREAGKGRTTLERSAEMLMCNMLQMLNTGKDVEFGEPSRPPDL